MLQYSNVGLTIQKKLAPNNLQGFSEYFSH